MWPFGRVPAYVYGYAPTLMPPQAGPSAPSQKDSTSYITQTELANASADNPAAKQSKRSSQTTVETTKSTLRRSARKPQPIKLYSGTTLLPWKPQKASKKVDHTYKDRPVEGMSPAPSPFLQRTKKRKALDETYKDISEHGHSPEPSPLLKKPRKRRTVSASQKPLKSSAPQHKMLTEKSEDVVKATHVRPPTVPSNLSLGSNVRYQSQEIKGVTSTGKYPMLKEPIRMRSLKRGLRLQTNFDISPETSELAEKAFAIPSIESPGHGNTSDSARRKSDKTVTWANANAVRIFNHEQSLGQPKLRAGLAKRFDTIYPNPQLRRSWLFPLSHPGSNQRARSKSVSPEPRVSARSREMMIAKGR